MNIAIIGTGNMGSGFARKLTDAGHIVTLAGRDSGKAIALAAELGNRATAADVRSAASNAQVIVLAVPYDQAVPVLGGLSDLSGKIVIDISNPLTPDYMALTVGHSTSAGEEIARAVPEARVVKAFNTVLAQVMAVGGDFGGGSRAQVFVASDDADAKATVSRLAEDMGFAASDAGGLRNARYLEPLAGQNIQFAYALGEGTQITPVWLKRAA